MPRYDSIGLILLLFLFCLTLPGGFAANSSRVWAQEESRNAGNAEPTTTDASAVSEATEPKTAQAETFEDAAAVTEQSVRVMVRRLESDTIQERDAAEKQLVEMGPSVLPFLPAVTARTSGEMKVRLQRIRQALESIDVGAYFEASTVTLSGTMQLAEALQQISEQTGNTIRLQGEDAVSGIEVKLDFTHESFWNVIDALLLQGNLRVDTNVYGGVARELVLIPASREIRQATPAFSSGPFHVEVSSIQATQVFYSPLNGQLEVFLQVAWEPRFEPVFMQLPMRTITAEVSDERLLSAVNPQASPEIRTNYGGCSTQVELQLERPDRSVQSLKKLSGEFVMAVPSARHKFEFQKFGNGERQVQKYGDLSVVLEGARRNGRNYQISLLVQFGDAQGALESFRGWILANQAYLLDAKRTRVNDIGTESRVAANNAVRVMYLFSVSGNPDDYTLVYESPASVTKQTVKYELCDIPLP